MLPDAHRLPSSLDKTTIGVGISLPVRLDLLTPPGRVLLGPRPVLRTPVPEAAVDEHGETEPRERDVHRTPRIRDAVVHAKPKAFPVQE